MRYLCNDQYHTKGDRLMADFTLKWFGDEVKADITEAAHQALLEAGADLQQLSSDEAPVKDGFLRGNATVDSSNLVASDFVTVGYNLIYALRQHEELSWHHPQGGKAKYLEDPFNTNVVLYMNHIAEAVNEVTK